jgi:uncharacterized protein (DUF1684 family)
VRLAACAALTLVSACSSGPGPVNGQSYEPQVLAWRAAKDASFRAKDNDGSPIPVDLRPTFAGLVYYPIDPVYHVPARLAEDRSGPPQIIQLQTSKDQHEPYRRVGALNFSIGDAPYRLTAFANGTMESLNRLFVPFGDLTNNAETYGGGRFLELDRTPTGLYDLDFNRAYHPFCVYNHAWECPVPPRENRLEVAIRAGEKLSK